MRGEKTIMMKEFLLVFVLYFAAFSCLGGDTLLYGSAALVVSLLMHATRYAKEPQCYVLRLFIFLAAFVVVNVQPEVKRIPAGAVMFAIALYIGYIGFKPKVQTGSGAIHQPINDRP